MPLDPMLIENTREWLTRADADIRSAVADLSVAPPIIEDVLFHSQQAAEKALKGFLTWHDVPFRKTHDLEELGAKCCEIDPQLKTVAERARGLTKFAWLFRYPGAPYQPTKEEADAALALARQVLAAVCDRLPPEARPSRQL